MVFIIIFSKIIMKILCVGDKGRGPFNIYALHFWHDVFQVDEDYYITLLLPGL